MAAPNDDALPDLLQPEPDGLSEELFQELEDWLEALLELNELLEDVLSSPLLHRVKLRQESEIARQ